jgi:hypothetical protein
MTGVDKSELFSAHPDTGGSEDKWNALMTRINRHAGTRQPDLEVLGLLLDGPKMPADIVRLLGLKEHHVYRPDNRSSIWSAGPRPKALTA